MDRPEWIGLLCGLGLGLVFGFWHVWSLRRREAGKMGVGQVAESALRLVMLMVALLVTAAVTGANKYWLTGSLAVAYSGPLFWQLRQAINKKK